MLVDHILDALQQPKVEPVPAVGRRGQYELAHQLRALDPDLRGDACPHAPAEEVGVRGTAPSEERGGIPRHLRVHQRPVDVGGAPMGLLLDRDHPPGFREGGQGFAE